MNVLINAAGMVGWLREFNGRLVPALQMVTDALLALAGMMLLDAAATPLAWIALLLPVFDAGVAFGAPAAGLAWGALSLVYIVLTLQIKPSDDSDANALGLAVQQLAAVAVVAVPAAYVGARMRDDLTHSRKARVDADHRAEELLVIAGAAQRLSDSTDSTEVLDIALGCATSLGFACVDVCERHGDRAWRLLRAAGSQRSLDPASNRSLDLVSIRNQAVTIGVGETSVSSAEVEELRLLGYHAGVALPISVSPGYTVALRAWSVEPLETDSSMLGSIELLATLTAGAWKSATTFSDLETWSNKLAHQATHDELTGLANRSHLFTRVEASLERMANTGVGFALLFLDLDGFKAVNDDLGHDAGDAVLQCVAERLGRQIRGHDVLARLGGDEFVVVLNDLPDRAAAPFVAERLCAAAATPFAVGSSTVTLGASIGIAYAQPGDTTDRLLSAADRLMYDAKRGGGNRFTSGSDSSF